MENQEIIESLLIKMSNMDEECYFILDRMVNEIKNKFESEEIITGMIQSGYISIYSNGVYILTTQGRKQGKKLLNLKG